MEQLQSIPNGARHVGAARRDAVGADEPHRRRRQPRRHADRLHRLRHDRPGARADRRHQHHGRHRRRRLLLRLRVARRSVPRHVAASRRKCRTPACSRSSSRARARNQFQGEYHLDWYNNSLQGSNLPGRVHRADGVQQQRRSASTATRSIATTTTTSTPAVRSRRTRSGSSAPTASSSTRWRSRTSSSTRPSTPSCGTPVGKGTYQVNQKNKLIGYYQWGQKEQPNRLPFATYTYASPEQTFTQDSGSWVYKGEWNGTISDKLYLEARYGDFGYYFPLITNSPDNFFWHDTGRADLGRRAPEAAARSRPQAVQPARPPTSSTPRKGSHTFKMGARDAEGAVVGRLRLAPRRHEQHRAGLQQRRRRRR